MRDLKKKTCKYVLAALFFMLLATAIDVQTAQAAVKLNATSVNLCVGDKYQLKLTGTTKKVTWKSSNTKIAKVDENGVVTGVAKGKATITATATDGSKKSGKVTVYVGKLIR